MAGLLTISALLAIHTTGAGSSNGGAFSSGMIAAAITLIIMGFQFTSNKEMSRVFAFPMSRKVLALGSFIEIIGVAFAFTYVIAVIGGFEALLGRILSSLFPRLLFSSYATLGSYAAGFWISASYLVLFMSASYAVGRFFHRFKIPTVAFFTLGVITFFVFPSTFVKVLEASKFFLYEQSLNTLSLKIWVSVVALHALSAFPLIRMEVKS